uniref:Transmembrane protein 26a n=1 Tax=Salarias fasciatus TaxID=181472 RepID=A0A672JNJ9_SALFA
VEGLNKLLKFMCNFVNPSTHLYSVIRFLETPYYLTEQRTQSVLPKIRLSVYSLSLQSYDRMLSFCYKDESLADYQVLLVLLILGKWLLPLGGGITKEELSQLLLNFVGTAADILEYLSETLEFIPEMIYTILAVWTWSMLQFPLHLSGQLVNSKADSEKEDEDSPDVSLWSKHSTDIWSIMEALFIQNGPFLVIRIIVMIYSKSVNEMTIFFAIKNFLVVILNSPAVSLRQTAKFPELPELSPLETQLSGFMLVLCFLLVSLCLSFQALWLIPFLVIARCSLS